MHDIQYPPQLATLNTMFIDGGPVAAQSGAQIDVRDPATNQVIGSLPRASASDVNHAVQCTYIPKPGGTWVGDVNQAIVQGEACVGVC
jgi:hypothetical protein